LRTSRIRSLHVFFLGERLSLSARQRSAPPKKPRTRPSRAPRAGPAPDSDPGADNRIRSDAAQSRSDQIRCGAPSGAADQISFRLGYDTLLDPI
jgi:hypothetical protein